MFVLSIVITLFQTCTGQMANGMWNTGTGGSTGGAEGTGTGTWGGQGMGMGFGPPGGFGPIPPEFAAAMNGGFNTQPPPIPMNMLGGHGAGMMGGHGAGMMGGHAAGMMGGHGAGMMGGHGAGMMGGHGPGMMGTPGMMGGHGMMGGFSGMMGMASPKPDGSKQSGTTTTPKPTAEYEPPEHTTKASKPSNIWQKMKQATQGGSQGSGAAISAAAPADQMNNPFQQQAIQHQQMQQQIHRQHQMQMQNGNQPQKQPQYSEQQKLGIMAKFSNSMNQMMSTFNSIRASLAQLITTLSKFVRLQ